MGRNCESWPCPPRPAEHVEPPSRGLPPLRDILHTAVANGASDVHIRAGAPPLIRVSGDLWPLDLPELTPEDTERIVLGGPADGRGPGRPSSPTTSATSR